MGEYVIEYSPGDEAYVDALEQELDQFHVPASSRGTHFEQILNAKNRRAELLARVTQSLSLKATPPKTAQMFDRLIELYLTMLKVEIPTPRHFSLWRSEELIARLKAGQKIPGMALESGDQLSFDLEISLRVKPDESLDEHLDHLNRSLRALILPIRIERDDQAPSSHVKRQLDEYAAGLADFGRLAVGMAANPFTLLHELVEITMVEAFLRSSDRRWFCDGVANYLAMRIVSESFGPGVASEYYDLTQQLQMHASVAKDVDLERWPAVENLPGSNYSPKLNIANYAYATRVIAEACARHGEEVLPALFAELGKTPPEQASMKTVYRAFRKVSGDDLRRLVSNAPQLAAVPLASRSVK